MNNISVVSCTDEEKRLVRVQLAGKLTYENGFIAREQLQGILEKLQEDMNCVLVVSDLLCISNSDFSVLIHLIRLVTLQHKRVAVVVADPYITELFKSSNFSQFIPIVSGEPEALLALDSGRIFPAVPKQT